MMKIVLVEDAGCMKCPSDFLFGHDFFQAHCWRWLNLRIFLHLLKSPKNDAKSISTKREDALDSRDFSQSEKLSEIKHPLEFTTHCQVANVHWKLKLKLTWELTVPAQSDWWILLWAALSCGAQLRQIAKKPPKIRL